MKTPEGIYTIDGRNPQAVSISRCIFLIRQMRTTRVLLHAGVPAGFDIMIHGIQNGRGWIGAFHRWKDWTAGCIAVTDEEIEELWRVTPDGTAIEIRP
jgi:murein L,D-transpeptidase YafK